MMNNYIKQDDSSKSYALRVAEAALAMPDDPTYDESSLGDEDQERTEFETWAKKEFPGLEVRRQNLLGTYTKTITEWLHIGWEAGRTARREGK